MDVNIFVNFNFRSSGTTGSERTKVLVLLEGSGKTQSVFGVSAKNSDGSTYKFSMTEDYDTKKHLYGLVPLKENIIYKFDEIKRKDVDNKKIELLKICSSELNRAFRQYLYKIDGKMNLDDQNKIYQELKKFKSVIDNLEFGKDESEEDAEKRYVEIKDIESDELNEIIQAVFENENEETVVNGKTYILKMEDDTLKIFEVIGGSTKTEIVEEVELHEENRPVKKVFTTKKMAMILTDDYVNFNKNELYECKKTESSYCFLVDNYNKVKTVRLKNVNLIDVYEEIDEEMFE